jgi:HD superfamily phosphodiesterase
MYPLPRTMRHARQAPLCAVPGVRYPDDMASALHEDDADAWASRVADVPAEWFAHASWLHGVHHTQRVHVHAQRLVRKLDWPAADANIVLTAALWHDIGRVNDGWDPRHGALSATRVRKRGLHSSLTAADARLALFAVRYHCRSDKRGKLRATGQHDPERALRILWLLKDADALDRVRLGDDAYEVDSTALRHGCTVEMVDFAVELLHAFP